MPDFTKLASRHFKVKFESDLVHIILHFFFYGKHTIKDLTTNLYHEKYILISTFTNLEDYKRNVYDYKSFVTILPYVSR